MSTTTHRNPHHLLVPPVGVNRNLSCGTVDRIAAGRPKNAALHPVRSGNVLHPQLISSPFIDFLFADTEFDREKLNLLSFKFDD